MFGWGEMKWERKDRVLIKIKTKGLRVNSPDYVLDSPLFLKAPRKKTPGVWKTEKSKAFLRRISTFSPKTDEIDDSKEFFTLVINPSLSLTTRGG